MTVDSFILFINKILFYLTHAGIFLATLSILVLFHEWGHFIVARFFGVRVLEFAFGMGKLLFSKKYGDTSYQFRMVPMGGYVKLAGTEEDLDKPDYRPQKDEFYGISPSRRIAVVFAGPAMNLILAMVAFWIGIFFTGQVLTKPVIGYLPPNSSASKAGILSGDLILNVNGIPIESLEQAAEIIAKSPDQKVRLEVSGASGNKNFELIPQAKEEQDLLGDLIRFGDIGLHGYHPAVIGAVSQDSPAEKAGLLPQDRIVEVNGETISFWEELVDQIYNNPGKRLSISWERDGKRHSGFVVPEEKEVNQSPEKKKKIGLIGISFQKDETMVFHKKVSPISALALTLSQLLDYTVLTYRALRKMILGAVSRDSVMGPVRLAGIVSKVASTGFFPWLMLLGFISLQLAIFNFLPFPALDGGQAFFFMLEFISRKQLDVRFIKMVERINQVGFTLLIGLFVLIMINDVSLLGK
ncbi:MAG: RIP metalloprotease RseP [Candidatus Aureabacteria bacterium]|nr:RIP metalloprotease RseP [Candidatus Auribacterota bacterium]